MILPNWLFWGMILPDNYSDDFYSLSNLQFIKHFHTHHPFDLHNSSVLYIE